MNKYIVALLVVAVLASSCVKTKDIDLECIDLDERDFHLMDASLCPGFCEYLFVYLKDTCFFSVSNDPSVEGFIARQIVYSIGYVEYDILADGINARSYQRYAWPSLTKDMLPTLALFEAKFNLEFYVYKPPEGLQKWVVLGDCIDRGFHKGRPVFILNVKSVVAEDNDGKEIILILDGLIMKSGIPNWYLES